MRIEIEYRKGELSLGLVKGNRKAKNLVVATLYLSKHAPYVHYLKNGHSGYVDWQFPRRDRATPAQVKGVT
jgi:hypothetical protein